MTFNFLGPGLTVNVEAKVKEQIILDSSEYFRLVLVEKSVCFRAFCSFTEPLLKKLSWDKLRKKTAPPQYLGRNIHDAVLSP